MAERTQSSLERLTSELQAYDSIMEPGIITEIKRFLLAGGKPPQAIHLLSKSYRGRAQMVNLMEGWTRSLGEDPNPPLISCLSREVKRRFDPRKANQILDAKSAPKWFQSLSKQKKWQPLMQELLDKYPECLFLQLLLTKLGPSKGSEDRSNVILRDDIDHTHFAKFRKEVRSLMANLITTISESSGKTDLEIKEVFESIILFASRSLPAYIYLQKCLNSPGIGDQPEISPLARKISEALRERAHQAEGAEEGGLAVTDTVITGLKQLPTLDSALQIMEKSGRAESLSVSKLHSFFCEGESSLGSLSVRFLRTRKVIERLIDGVFNYQRVFAPEKAGGGSGTSKLHRAKCVDLLAFASTAPQYQGQATGDSTHNFEETRGCIDEMSEILLLPRFSSESLESAIVCLSNPMAAWGFLRWIEGRWSVDVEEEGEGMGLSEAQWVMLSEVVRHHPLLISQVGASLESAHQKIFSPNPTDSYGSVTFSRQSFTRNLGLAWAEVAQSGGYHLVFQKLSQSVGMKDMVISVFLSSFFSTIKGPFEKDFVISAGKN
ncbi:hypothetical protein AAMO2058_001172700 [Amorphochlora amoebiformis]